MARRSGRKGKGTKGAMSRIVSWMEYFDGLVDSLSPAMFTAFRAGTGLFFLKHGLAKLGILGQLQPFLSLLWFAGIIEVAVGISLVLNIFPRMFSLLGAATMAVAYVLVHLPKGWEGLDSGELAILYFLAFLGISAYQRRKP